jgi:hypothetical protein
MAEVKTCESCGNQAVPGPRICIFCGGRLVFSEEVLVPPIQARGSLTDTQNAIATACDEVKTLLLRKNAAYGDSVMSPMRVFSRASPEEAIRVRLDDKLSRIKRGHAIDDESMDDTIDDAIGYLVLLKIARARRASVADAANVLDKAASTLSDVFPEQPEQQVSAVMIGSHAHPFLVFAAVGISTDLVCREMARTRCSGCVSRACEMPLSRVGVFEIPPAGPGLPGTSFAFGICGNCSLGSGETTVMSQVVNRVRSLADQPSLLPERARFFAFINE